MKRLFCIRTPWIQIPADKVLKMKHLDLQKRFPICHVCPKCLAALLCGSAFLSKGLAFFQELDEVGKTLVDWQRGNFHCELIQHPENLLSFESFIQLISFCESYILPISSKIVSWSSTNLRLAIVSKAEL